MGRLTDEMTRLRNELNAAQQARIDAEVTRKQAGEAYNQELANNVATMRAGFREAHAQMAQETKQARMDAEATRKKEAQETIAQRQNAERARRKDAEAFMSNLKETVSNMRAAIRDDLMGARNAWLGKTSAEAKKPQPKAPPPVTQRPVAPAEAAA